MFAVLFVYYYYFHFFSLAIVYISNIDGTKKNYRNQFEIILVRWKLNLHRFLSNFHCIHFCNFFILSMGGSGSSPLYGIIQYLFMMMFINQCFSIFFKRFLRRLRFLHSFIFFCIYFVMKYSDTAGYNMSRARRYHFYVLTDWV